MRYKTFRNVVFTCVAGAGVLGLYSLCRGKGPSAGPEEPAMPAAAKQAPAQASPAANAVHVVPPIATAPATASTDSDALRPMDNEILERVAKNISGDKVKDAVPGRPWKVNLYKDAGQTIVNRLKIDLNRNERWEEKWTFANEGGKLVVKRQVAPADDEKYTVEYLLEGGRWRRK